MVAFALLLAFLGFFTAWLGWPKYRLRNLLRIDPKIDLKDRFTVYNETQRTFIQVIGIVSLAGTFYFGWRSLETAAGQLRLAEQTFTASLDRQEVQLREQIRLAQFVANENARLAKRRLIYERKIDALKSYNRAAGGTADLFIKCMRLRRQIENVSARGARENAELDVLWKNYDSFFGEFTSWTLTHSIEASALTTVSGRAAPQLGPVQLQSPTDLEDLLHTSDIQGVRLRLYEVSRTLRAIEDRLPKLGKETGAFIHVCYRDFQTEADQN